MRAPRRFLGRPLGDAVGMRPNTANAPVTEVDREELDRHIAAIERARVLAPGELTDSDVPTLPPTAAAGAESRAPS